MCCQPGNRHGLPASDIDRRRRYSIKMQPRWNHARSAAQPNSSSHAQGLEGKEISSPSGRGRKMSLTSPLIEQALAQACAIYSPQKPGHECYGDISPVRQLVVKVWISQGSATGDVQGEPPFSEST
jgi:hypothetical protein